ncbi:agmatinase family protein [Streptomyces sp. NPDC049916]|uniref:agmatinase family protein n=1 Tax=Streptomyces sp. NPDC049916 TaxID=3155156 RepID=UPI00344A888B
MTEAAEPEWGASMRAARPRLGTGTQDHAAVDHYNENRKPGPFYVQRAYEYGRSGVQSYMGLPVCLTPEDLVAGEIEIAACGVPWDATATGRSGARFGPVALRTTGMNSTNEFTLPDLHTRVDPFKVLRCADYGDAPIATGNTPETFEDIRKFVTTVLEAGARPVVLGGDHGITWPSLTAVADHHGHGRVGVIHLGAHTAMEPVDSWDMGGARSALRRTVDSGVVRAEHVVTLGSRGFHTSGLGGWLNDNKVRVHPAAEIDRRGIGPVIDELIAGCTRPGAPDSHYLSISIDVADPMYAPGTGSPEPGGLRSTSLLRSVRRIGAEVDLAGIELVELSPHWDNDGQITTLLAHRVLHHTLTGMALRRLGITEPDWVHPDALDHGLTDRPGD